MKWTIELIRYELPDITIIVDKKRYTGKVSGARNDFPIVTVDCGCAFCKRGYLHRIEYSWATLQYILNELGGEVKL